MNRLTDSAEGKEGMLPRLFILVIGAAFGAASQFDPLYFPLEPLGMMEKILRVIVAIVVSPLLFTLLRRFLRAGYRALLLPPEIVSRYLRYDTFTYTVLLFPILGVAEVSFYPPAIFATVMAFLGAQLLLTIALMGRRCGEIFRSAAIPPAAFHISGFCALIYQVVWQRVLFTEFGVNIESITVVVSVFMLGLGLGSLTGGFLSTRYPDRLPHLFMACELCIGVFGVFSLQLIRVVSGISGKDSLMTTSMVVFSLLFVPTLLMGATLPLLVTYLHRTVRNVGVSVGLLYFINTLGAAFGCFITTDIIFALFGKQTAVLLAACGNFLIVMLMHLYMRAGVHEMPGVAAGTAPPDTKSHRLLPVVLLLSGITGYISLSQEILWFRAMAYVTGGSPFAFGHILGLILAGIALGSLAAKRICRNSGDASLTYIAAMLTISALAYYFSFPLIGRLLTLSEPAGMAAAYVLVVMVSFLAGGVFPLLCHTGVTSDGSVGSSLSWIYFANILGSTAGPLITGFVLLDSLPMERIILYLCMAALLLGASVFAISPLSRKMRGYVMAGVVIAAVSLFTTSDRTYMCLLEKLQFKTSFDLNKRYKHVIQNRNGIIAVTAATQDVIYGGGMYDGRFSTDPVSNVNGITRAYMMAALHPDPVDVLEIGLSSGSWAKAISCFSGLKKLTVVEINPGYQEIVSHYPDISTIFHDPKVEVVINDGRRWLNANPARKFDFIVMNTTFHWRDGVTNLLSREFMHLCRQHLNPGGVMYFNTTGSADAVYTAAKTFRHIARFSSFVAASDSPFAMDQGQRRANLLRFREQGVPIFARTATEERVLDTLAASDLSDKANEYAVRGDLRMITDDNMATEFKRRQKRFH